MIKSCYRAANGSSSQTATCPGHSCFVVCDLSSAIEDRSHPRAHLSTSQFDRSLSQMCTADTNYILIGPPHKCLSKSQIPSAVVAYIKLLLSYTVSHRSHLRSRRQIGGRSSLFIARYHRFIIASRGRRKKMNLREEKKNCSKYAVVAGNMEMSGDDDMVWCSCICS